MSERRRALIVANFEYQCPAFRRLTAPAQDAEELARVLRNPAIGLFEVETLLNQKAAVVTHAIEEFFVFSDPKPDDLLLLYFSGHGVTDDEGQLYLATIDTELVRQNVRQATAVGGQFVDAVMRRSRSRRQVLLLDCCHSGAFAEGMRIKGQPLPGLETHFQGKGRIVLTASTGMQFSLEGSSETEAQPSVYTRILVKALETGEADRDGDGWVDLDELHDYLVDQVRAEAPQQTPTKGGYLEGQLYIARTAVLRPAKLPPNLQSALTAPEMFTRHGAVFAVNELLQGEHPGLALAAQQALAIRRDHDDSLTVRKAAKECLAAYDARKLARPRVEPLVAEKARATVRAQEERAAVDERERQAEDRGEQEDLARQRLEAERQAAKREEVGEKARERAEQERLVSEQAEAGRAKRAKAKQERLAREKAEAERITQAEAERAARAQTERERLAAEKGAAESAPVREAEAKYIELLKVGEGLGDRVLPQQPSEGRRLRTYLVAPAVVVLVLAIAWVFWPSATNRDNEADRSRQVASRTIASESENKSSAPPKYALACSTGASMVFTVDFSTDGQRLASVGTEGKVDLWDVSSCGTLVRSLPHRNVEKARFSPDGRLLASAAGGALAKIKIWDTTSWQNLGELPAHGAVLEMDVGPKLLAAITSDGLHLYDFRNLTELRIPNALKGKYYDALAHSRDGRWLATAADRTVEVWDTATWVARYSFTDEYKGELQHPTGVTALAFSPEGNSLSASSFSDTAVTIWDLTTGQKLHTLSSSHYDKGVSSLAFRLDGRVLASGAYGAAILWDTKDWSELQPLVVKPLAGSTDLWVQAVDFSPDGQWLATGSVDKPTVQLWRRTE